MDHKGLEHTNHTSLTETEKVRLKDIIMTSMHAHNRRKKRRRRNGAILTAAVLTILITSFFVVRTNQPSIQQYAQTVQSIDSKDFNTVKLILNDSEKIDIDQDNSTVSYSNLGKQISIDNHRTINQTTTKNDQPVYNTMIVPYGKRSKIELSDGSHVWLNSGSKLIYPAVFTGHKREVYLEGEAIFEVAHDNSHPFMVIAENHEIEVLGTVFNVSNYSDEESISTTLKSGSVQINYHGDSFFKKQESIKIIPGSKAIYHKGKRKISSKVVDVTNDFSWREGVLIFKNNTMDHIMKRLARYYNVNIVIKSESSTTQTFSGYLDLKEDVENVIQIIRETTDFEYRIENKTITIN